MSEAQKQDVIAILKDRSWSLGFAESCTGGLISAQATQIPGVSAIYKGGVVSYSNDVKAHVLGIPETFLKTHGAVSEAVALQMALGAQYVLQSRVTLSVTGIAGPGGGTASKPVGLVFLAVVGPGFEKVERQLFTGSNGESLSRDIIQQKTAARAWELLAEVLKA